MFTTTFISMSEQQLSFRELWKMGVYKLPPREIVMTTTISGRVAKPPRKFEHEQFVKGSGVARIRGRDYTDMSYDGQSQCKCYSGKLTFSRCSICDGN